MKKIMIFGTFDIIHKGHLNLINQTKKHGDYFIIVVARDKTVKKVKGKYPRNNEKKRANALKKYADKVVLGYLKDKYKIIKKLKPDMICLGYDQKTFIKDLKKLNIKIKRLKPYKPHKYKSSKF